MVDIVDKTYRQIFCYNKDIGHLFVPNLNARIMNEKGGYFVKTNSFGFRSNLEFKKKKNNKRNIDLISCLIRDSFVTRRIVTNCNLLIACWESE